VVHLQGCRRDQRLPVPGVQAAPVIYTSHWRSPLLEDADAVIVSISRGQPRWRLPFRYRRLPELAPDDATWAQEDEEAFEGSYLDQLAKLGAERIVADLERIAAGHPIILLCWERPHEEICHRWALARFIEQEAGIVVPELSAGMVGKRPDAQPVLFDEKEGA
jgi:uncharacterized protein DUF488